MKILNSTMSAMREKDQEDFFSRDLFTERFYSVSLRYRCRM